jgi:hypothetical protein|nr:MAG TPA: hypothetical protein [Caudoviricetes sp.]
MLRLTQLAKQLLRNLKTKKSMNTYHITYSYKLNGRIFVVDCNIEEVHKSDIKRGDTILSDNGNTKTIGRQDISFDSFLGRCICGDSYKLGKKLVKRVTNLKMGTPTQFGY